MLLFSSIKTSNEITDLGIQNRENHFWNLSQIEKLPFSDSPPSAFVVVLRLELLLLHIAVSRLSCPRSPGTQFAQGKCWLHSQPLGTPLPARSTSDVSFHGLLSLPPPK